LLTLDPNNKGVIYNSHQRSDFFQKKNKNKALSRRYSHSGKKKDLDTTNILNALQEDDDY